MLEEYYDEIKACLDEGMTDYEIADWIGSAQPTVRKFRLKYRLEANKRLRFCRRFDERWGENALRDLLTWKDMGVSNCKAGKAFGTSHQMICQILDKCKTLDIRLDNFPQYDIGYTILSCPTRPSLP